MKESVLEFGSNIGNKIENIKKAIHSINCLPNTKVTKISRFYETEPFGVPDKQDNYINCCAQVFTTLSPFTLLGACLGIESSMGRVRLFKNQARIIDIDLLLYEDFSLNSSELTVPHPRILERSFVMVPLSDIYKNKIALNLNFKDSLYKIGTDGVKLIHSPLQ